MGRFYEINGGVVLRVMFLASGEIGSVSVIRGLPFGLTDSAMKAVKNIRFAPEIKNDHTVDGTRLVEYTFALY